MNKRICLTSPPSRSINHYRPPVALLYLAGYLEKKGIEVDIVDIVLEKQVRDADFDRQLAKNLKEVERRIIEQVRQLDPGIVGITCYTPEYFEVKSLAQKIKNFNPEIKIIVGGIHPTFYPEDFAYRGSLFDFAVRGEGEITLLELVRNLEKPKAWPKIESFAYFDSRSRKMVITPQRPLAKDLDKISYPAYHKINMTYYSTANPYAIRGVYTRSAYVLSSRGCPSQCTFCVAKKIREFCGNRNYTRLRSPENLFQEIKSLKEKYKIDAFYFIDDLFTLNKEHVKEFCRQLRKARLGLIWGCSSKVTTVDYATLKTMRDAGCVQIDFGVERGSDRALQLIKKGITIKVIKRVFKNCSQLGIRTFANMLVNLPQETEQDLEDVLQLLEEIKPTIVAINIFIPYPGTEIFDTHKRGITKKDYPKLMRSPIALVANEPRKYRFAEHQVDFGNWVLGNDKKYNRILPNLKFYLSGRYLKNLLRSQEKLNYLMMSKQLVLEFLAQKF